VLSEGFFDFFRYYVHLVAAVAVSYVMKLPIPMYRTVG